VHVPALSKATQYIGVSSGGHDDDVDDEFFTISTACSPLTSNLNLADATSVSPYASMMTAVAQHSKPATILDFLGNCSLRTLGNGMLESSIEICYYCGTLLQKLALEQSALS
jgi:hypothetical protein